MTLRHRTYLVEGKLSKAEREMLSELRSGSGLLRKLMDKGEIRIADALIKRGLVHRGISDDRQRTVQYVITTKGEEALR